MKTIKMKELSEKTGIPLPTLYYWRHKPCKIPLGRLAVLVKVLGLTDEEIVRLVRKGERNVFKGSEIR